jgi:hypothetical protein
MPADDHFMFDDSQFMHQSQTTNQGLNVLNFNRNDIENSVPYNRNQIVREHPSRGVLGIRNVPKSLPFGGFDEDSMLSLPYT